MRGVILGGDNGDINGINGMMRRAAEQLADRPVVVVEVTYPDGSKRQREWTWRQIDGGDGPNIELMGNLQPWMIEPTKSWPDPQDPITYRTGVKVGSERDATAWIEAL